VRPVEVHHDPVLRGPPQAVLVEREDVVALRVHEVDLHPDHADLGALREERLALLRRLQPRVLVLRVLSPRPPDPDPHPLLPRLPPVLDPRVLPPRPPDPDPPPPLPRVLHPLLHPRPGAPALVEPPPVRLLPPVVDQVVLRPQLREAVHQLLLPRPLRPVAAE